VKRWSLALLSLILVACGTPQVALIPTPTVSLPQGTPELVHLVCPESVEPLARGLISAYQRANPAVQVMLVQRADLLAWGMLERVEVDAAILTMPLPDARPDGTWHAVFARDGLAVIVNPQNGVPGLTLAQLRELFMGRTEDWEPLGGFPGLPQLASREDASGDHIFFQNVVMEDFPVTLTAFLMPNTTAVLDFVAQEPLGVGYLSSARVDDRVRALAIEEIPPADALLTPDLYPLTRDLLLVTMDVPEGATRDFLQWVLSAQGQAVVSELGWHPAAE